MPEQEYDVIEYNFNEDEERGLIGDYARRLYYWYVNNYLFYSGELKVVGHPDYRVGDRLYYTNESDNVNWEYYIESVEHNFTLEEGYTTSLGVTRGLKVANETDEGIRFSPPAGEPQEFEGGYMGEVSISSLRQASTQVSQANSENDTTVDTGEGRGSGFSGNIDIEGGTEEAVNQPEEPTQPGDWSSGSR